MMTTKSCEHCDYTSTDRSNIRRHKKFHLSVENRQFGCLLCTKKFATKSDLNRHEKKCDNVSNGDLRYGKRRRIDVVMAEPESVDDNIETVIRELKKQLESKDILIAQLQEENSKLEMSISKGCTACRKKEFSGEKPFACNQCSYSCSVAGDLKTHMRTHSEEKPFACKQCSYSCSQAGNLKTHMGTHYGENQLKIRRSSRKPESVLLQQERDSIEAHLKRNDDSTLGLMVQEFTGRGRGVVATRNFDKNNFVVEYHGEIVNIGEAKKREAIYSLDSNVGSYMFYFKDSLGRSFCVDATNESGRYGRLINHSKENQNLKATVFMIENEPRLILKASKYIPAGQELHYDYNDKSQDSLKLFPWLGK